MSRFRQIAVVLLGAFVASLLALGVMVGLTSNNATVQAAGDTPLPTAAPAIIPANPAATASEPTSTTTTRPSKKSSQPSVSTTSSTPPKPKPANSGSSDDTGDHIIASDGTDCLDPDLTSAENPCQYHGDAGPTTADQCKLARYEARLNHQTLAEYLAEYPGSDCS